MDEKRSDPRRYRWIQERMYILSKREVFLTKERVAPPKDIKNIQIWQRIMVTG